MAGLLVFAVLGGYVLISVLIVYRVLRAAPQKKLVAGVLATLVVTLPVTTMFWEYVQTKRTFERYCREEAKVTIFKTVEQWKKENPGVAETLQPYTDKNRPAYQYSGDGLYNTSSTEYLNRRFALIKKEKVIQSSNVFRQTNEVVDTETSNIMIRWVDYRSGYGNPFLGTPYGFKSYKVWLSTTGCSSHDKSVDLFFDYIELIKNIGGEQP